MARLVNSKDISPLYTVLVVEFTPSRSKAVQNAQTEGKVFCESTHSGASRSSIGRERECVGRVYGYSRDDEDVTGKVPCSASVSFAVRERTQSSRHAGAHIIQWASSLHRLCMLGVVHPHTLSLHFLAPRLQILFLPSP